MLFNSKLKFLQKISIRIRFGVFFRVVDEVHDLGLAVADVTTDPNVIGLGLAETSTVRWISIPLIADFHWDLFGDWHRDLQSCHNETMAWH